MKKTLVLSLSLVGCLFLTACPAPNAAESGDSTDKTASETNNSSTDSSNGSATGSSGDSNFSKAAYITLLNCLKTQQPDAAVAIDQAIAAANQLPDSAFDNADSPVFAVWAQQAEAAGCK